MRSKVGILAAVVCWGCAIDLAPEDGQPGNAGVSAPAIQKCKVPLMGVDTLEGRLDSARVDDGQLLLVSAMATIGSQVTSAGLGVTREGDCPRVVDVLAAPIIDVSALASDLLAVPLGVLSTAPAYLYFSTLREDGAPGDGIGVARYEPGVAKFVAVTWLWTRDRPSYGSSAVLNGNTVYVFGGKAARFLAADVYLARVPLSEIEQSAAYEYWQGGGNWGAEADLAAPLVEGGVSPSVAWNPVHERWLMAYATPLARDVTVRTGLDVKGPWSAPISFAACDLPSSDAQSFCDDVVLHPLLAEPDDIVLSHAVRSFNRLASAPLSDYETRLLHSTWPTTLP